MKSYASAGVRLHEPDFTFSKMITISRYCSVQMHPREDMTRTRQLAFECYDSQVRRFILRRVGAPKKFVSRHHVSGFIMICLVLSLRGFLDPQLALRVPPAVTWLAVYRWLQIPVRIVLAQRRIRKNVGADHF